MEWIYPVVAILLITLLAGIFTGCAVVKTNVSSGASKKATVYYYLPESLVKIKSTVKVAVKYNMDDSTLNESSAVVEQSFSTSSEMIADTRDLLSLNYIPNALMADEIKYAVNAKGLLQTVNITTDDRTAATIEALSKAPQAILGVNTGADKGDGVFVRIKEYSAEFLVKASEITADKRLVKWKIILTNDLKDDNYTTADADFSVMATNFEKPLEIKTILKPATGESPQEINGILTRPLKNIELVFTCGTDKMESRPVSVSIADVNKLVTIPVNRTAFVKRTNKIEINDGMIMSNEIVKPSSVEGFASIPVNVAKAIVSIPAQLVTFKIDNTKRTADLEKNKLLLEKALEETKTYAITKIQDLEKVKLDQQKATLTNELALEKLKLELAKEILIAEKNKLDAQKELDKLKKEIEELKKGK